MVSKKSKKLIRYEIFLIILCFFVLAGPGTADEEKDEFALLASQSLKFSGYTQVSYTHTDDGINGFRIRRARAGLKGEILKNINYALQIDSTKSTILLDAKETELTSSPWD